MIKLFDKRTAQALFTALTFGLVLLFLYAAWRAIIAFLFAIFFAYLMEAPVSRLEKWFRGSRAAAIAATYAIFIGGLVLLFVLVGPSVMDEVQKLSHQAPALADRLSSGNLVRQIGEQHGWSRQTMEIIDGYLHEHRGEMIGASQQFLLRAVRSVQNTWWLLLVPILAIFFLKDGRSFAEKIIGWVENSRHREIVAMTIEEMNFMLGHFIRAQLTFAALAMVVVTFVLWAMRVPYAFALGPAAGALEFIPVVGPVVGGLLVVGVAFTSGYAHVWWLVIFLLVWRGIQDYVTSPRIMGSTLELHPLLVLFGVFAGGEVAGVIGVFLSIPVLATLRILWHTWQLTRKPHAEHVASL
jgi:predicted PurR-regulated permease PerM